MTHFKEKLGVASILALAVSILIGYTSRDLSTTLYSGTSTLLLSVLGAFCYAPLYSLYVDYRAHQRDIAQFHHSRQLEVRKLTLEAAKHTDAISLERVRIAIEEQKAQTAHLVAVLENQIKAQHVRIEELKVTAAITRPISLPAPTQVQPVDDDEEEPEDYSAPTVQDCLEKLRYNELQLCLGTEALTGESRVVSFEKGVHFKIIGSSGMGKSCDAAGTLYQLTEMNDQDHLLLALLDMEHMTSRLFENCNHIAELRHRGSYVPMVATDADQVAQRLILLCKELDRRASNNILNAALLLIYVEEFLSLRAAILDEKLKESMLASFTRLAVQGRKYRMYLLACAQDDYADEQLKSAKNQFGARKAYCVSPTAARSANFVATDLIKKNYENAVPGQYVLEGVYGKPTLMLAPRFSVERELDARGLLPDRHTTAHSEAFRPRTTGVQTPFRDRSEAQPFRDVNAVQHSSGRFSDDELNGVKRWHFEQGLGKAATILKVWQVQKGGSAEYQRVARKYDDIVTMLSTEEQLEA